MAGVGFVSYEYDDANGQAFFTYAGYKARNPRPPLRDAGDAILRHVHEAFMTEGTSIGHTWDDLADGYIPEKIRTYGHVYPILVGTGGLKRDATAAQAIGIRVLPDGGYVTYRVRNRLASFHQQPYGPETGKMPHRPFYDMTTELRQEIDQIFIDWLDELKAAHRDRRHSGGINPLL